MGCPSRGSAVLVLFAVACATPKERPSQTEEDTISRIRRTHAIRIGYRESSIPFSFLGTDGKPIGYSIDLCNRIVDGIEKETGVPDLRTEWVKVNPDTRVDALLNYAIDLECGSTTITLSRQEQVDFSNLTFVDGASLLSRNDIKIHTIGDLSGKRIAVIPGTTTEALVRSAFAKAGMTSQIMSVKDHGEGLAAVTSRQADAYASDRAILLGLALTSSDPKIYAMVDRNLSYEPYGLMLRRDPRFRLAVNRQLARIYGSGNILDLYGKWFGQFGEPTDLLISMYKLYALPE